MLYSFHFNRYSVLLCLLRKITCDFAKSLTSQIHGNIDNADNWYQQLPRKSIKLNESEIVICSYKKLI